jgi:hypothetical protein
MAGRIVGIGGVFFKSGDKKALTGWYKEHLGFGDNAMFQWLSKDEPAREQMTVWSVFPSTSTYMDQPFMINYIVEGLDELLETLSGQGVKIDPKRDDHEYGRFAWIYDLDGNKIELWEPPKS